MKKFGPWTQLSSKYPYRNEWMAIREDMVIRPDGTKGIFAVVEKNSAVFIVAMNEQKKFCFIKQYRYTTRIEGWEIPAGSSDGGDLDEAAERELQEETGFSAGKIEQIGKFQTAKGIANEISYTYLAQDLKQTSENKMREEGITDMKFFSYSEIIAMIKSGEMNDSLSITPLFQTFVHLGLIS